MANDDAIKQLIHECFRLGQAGYNEAEDESYYKLQMLAVAKKLNLTEEAESTRTSAIDPTREKLLYMRTMLDTTISCIEKGFTDEALLHSNMLRVRLTEIIDPKL